MAQSMDEFVEGLRVTVAGWKVDVARFEAQEEADELAALVARWIAEAEKLIATYESQDAWRTPRPVTVLERVRDLIVRLAPKAVCDACIAGSLDLSQRRHASIKTRALAQAGGFERSRGICRICGQSREVISVQRS